MATNEQHNHGTTRDDTATTTDRALVVALKGSATEGSIPVTLAGAPGTVTADQGTPAVVADAWPIKVTDGTDTAVVENAAPALNSQALVVRVLDRPATSSAVTRVAAIASNTTLLAANTNRVSAGFCNNSTSANLYIKLGATASLAAGTESFTVKVAPGGFFRLYQYEYTGIIDGIWDSAEAGAECLITELT
jgi:hypothetical protein